MANRSASRVPVTLSALHQRLNRKLKLRHERVYKSRAPSSEIGAYYRVDLKQNRVLDPHVNLIALARELGVIKAWEEITSRGA